MSVHNGASKPTYGHTLLFLLSFICLTYSHFFAKHLLKNYVDYTKQPRI